VVEGKHYTEIGANYIKSLYSIINKEHEGVNFTISQQIIDLRLRLSESNYAETEQEPPRRDADGGCCAGNLKSY